MVSTPEGFSEKIPISSGPYVSIKQPKAIKSLRQFSTTLDVKPRTVVIRLFTAKLKRKSIRSGSQLCYKTKKRQGHTTINEDVNVAFYRWILRHPQNFKSPIDNDCVKDTIYGKTTLQLVPKLFLKVPVRELHNNVVSPI